MERIQFHFKGRVVGETDLTEFSDSRERNRLALNAGVGQYDRFILFGCNPSQRVQKRFDSNDMPSESVLTSEFQRIEQKGFKIINGQYEW